MLKYKINVAVLKRKESIRYRQRLSLKSLTSCLECTLYYIGETECMRSFLKKIQNVYPSLHPCIKCYDYCSWLEFVKYKCIQKLKVYHFIIWVSQYQNHVEFVETKLLFTFKIKKLRVCFSHEKKKSSNVKSAIVLFSNTSLKF